jgi:hypothetical protein
MKLVQQGKTERQKQLFSFDNGLVMLLLNTGLRFKGPID